ncbi:MAG: hypothetical protein RLZZ15_3065 [Verrucomicrobiota bacterium]
MNTDFAEGVLWYAVFLFSTVCHEAAHAWSALRLGDDTASRGGQVSLNPLPHIRREIMGMVVVPILSWLFGGWIMGWASAPYDPEWARKYPRRAALMALAGPAANLALVIGAGLLLRVGVEWHVFEAPYSLKMSRIAVAADPGIFVFLAKLLSIAFSLNLLLCVLNLLPLPPLDGSSLPLLVLPESAARRYFDVMRAPALRIIGMFVVFRFGGMLFPPVLRTFASLLFPGHAY